MPKLNAKELNLLLSKKERIIQCWHDAKIGEFQRIRPINPDKSRVSILDWLTSFEPSSRDNLIELKSIFDKFINTLFESNLSQLTKINKVTEFRKELSNLIGEKYYGEMYHYLPYCLMIIPDNSIEKENSEYKEKVKSQNLSDNRVKISMEIIDKLIELAVTSLRKKSENKRDIASKAVALELLTGRRQYSEILNPKTIIKFYHLDFFKAENLAKSKQDNTDLTLDELPILGRQFEQYEGEISDLILSARKEILNEIEKDLEINTSSIQNLWKRPIIQALIPYDLILKDVRKKNSNLEPLNGSTHLLRKIYAFSCYQKFHKHGNESQYFGRILGHGKFDKKGNFQIDLETSLSYSIFTLDD